MDFLDEYLMDGRGTIERSIYKKSCHISIPQVFEKLANHPILYFREVSELKLDLKNLNIEEREYILDEDIKYKQIFVFYAKNQVKLSMPSWSTLSNFIAEHSNLIFILISILMTIEDDTIRHTGLLIFHGVDRKVYYFDPNGESDNILNDVDFGEIEVPADCIDLLFFQYFENTGYEYNSAWEITLGEAVNWRYYLEFDRGNCGSWVILFGLMVLNSGEKNLSKLYKKILDLKWSERGYLIYNFIDNYIEKYMDSD